MGHRRRGAMEGASDLSTSSSRHAPDNASPSIPTTPGAARWPKNALRGAGHLLGPLAWRYIALGAQFALVLLIARKTSLETADSYFAIFGMLLVTSPAVGIGATDGLVAMVPRVRLQERGESTAAALTRSATRVSLISAVTVVALAAAVTAIMSLDAAKAALVVTWWLAYAATFVAGQVLVARGDAGSGAFIAYSSLNIAYLLAFVPYLAFTPRASLSDLLLVGTSSAVAAAALSGGYTALRLRRGRQSRLRSTRPSETGGASVRQLLRVGMPIAGSRVLQAALAWTPVWVLGMSSHNGEAAIYATASRLGVVVTAILGAIRFAARPQIVRMHASGDVAGIIRYSRQASALSVIGVLAAALTVAILGDQGIARILGESYADAAPVFLILMVGVLAEAYGGLSDEILKMTGAANVVVLTLLVATLAQVIGSTMLISGGARGVAWATVAAFALQYALQVQWLRRYRLLRLWPSPRRLGLRERMSGDS